MRAVAEPVGWTPCREWDGLRVGDVATPHRLDGPTGGHVAAPDRGPQAAGPAFLMDVIPDPVAFALAAGLRPAGEWSRLVDPEFTWVQLAPIDDIEDLRVVTAVADLSRGVTSEGGPVVCVEFVNDLYQGGTGRHLGNARGATVFEDGTR